MVYQTLISLQEYDVRIREGLITIGFKSLGKWGDILRKGLPKELLLENPGVYSVLRLENSPPNFLPPEIAKNNKNVLKPLSVQQLEKFWIQNVDVLYFGAAGLQGKRSLKKRLNDMKRHCLGDEYKSKNHKGGEILWQLQNYEMFEILILATTPFPIPRLWECALNRRFFDLTNKLPFANSEV